MNKKLLVIMLVLLVARLSYSQMVGVGQGYGKNNDKNDKNKDKEDENEFKTKFSGKYKGDQEAYRIQVFKQNKAQYEAHNKDPSNTETMGVTKFSDLTEAEFVAKYLNLKVRPKISNVQQNLQVSYTVPTIDWVSKGMVTSIKDQGDCGSCWAFSALGAMESALKKKGVSADLSEQELVDCAGDYGNMGCDGGWMGSALDYVLDNGVSSEKDYPYKGVDQNCKTRTAAYKISTYTEKSGCAALAAGIAVGPVSVAVDATRWGGYVKGILSKCGTSLNHAVIVVGASPTEWKIKNSWGSSWGENGYIRLKTGNTCGVCKWPTLPTA